MFLYRNFLIILLALIFSSLVFADTLTSFSSSAAITKQPAATLEAKVNLNKATVKELMKVKGINAAKARAIVAYRKKHQRFTVGNELAKVKGFKKMKPERLKEIEDQVSVD